MFAVGGGERSATTSERLFVLECLPTTLQVLFGLILDDGQLFVYNVLGKSCRPSTRSVIPGNHT